MNNKIIKLIVVTLLLSMVLISCSPQAETAPDTFDDTAAEEVAVDEEVEEKAPIRIGLHGPLTGPIAFLGQGFEMGIQLAIEDLGGEIGGYPLEFIVADNVCNPTDAVNAVQKLIYEDEVDVMIGGGCSSATVAALPIVMEGQVAQVSATSTTPSIYNQIGIGGNEWAFRINPDDLIMAQGFAEEILERSSPTKISLVAENTDFGRGAMNAYKPLFESFGVEIATEDYFDLGTSDFRPALTGMKGSGSEAVLIVMTENDCANFMRQYREVGVEADVFSRGACTSKLFLELTEDDPNIGAGIIEFTFWHYMDPDLMQRFPERWDTPLTMHRMGGYYAMYYAVAPAIRYLVDNDIPISRESIRDALETLDVETPAGPIKFDEHNQAYPNGVLIQNVIQADGTLTSEVLSFVELGPVDHTGY